MPDKKPWQNWLEILRAYSWTASFISVALAGVLAARAGEFSWFLFLAITARVILIHTASNILNEYYDTRYGMDDPEADRPSSVLLEGRIRPKTAFRVSCSMALVFLAGLLFFSWYLGRPLLLAFGLLAAMFLGLGLISYPVLIVLLTAPLANQLARVSLRGLQAYQQGYNQQTQEKSQEVIQDKGQKSNQDKTTPARPSNRSITISEFTDLDRQTSKLYFAFGVIWLLVLAI